MFTRLLVLAAVMLSIAAQGLAQRPRAETYAARERIELSEGREAWVWTNEDNGVVTLSFGGARGTYKPAEVLPRVPDAAQYGQVKMGSFRLSGDDVSALRRFTRLRELKVTRAIISGAAMKELGSLTGLTGLDLSSATIAAENNDAFARLKNLRVLNAVDSNITDAAMPPIGALDELSELFLRGTAVSDKGAAEVAHLKNLTKLSLGGAASHITDAGAASLGQLTKLRVLALPDARITSASGPVLGKLIELEELYLGSTLIDSKALAELGGLQKLRVLDLDNTNVGDDGLRYLASNSSLENISLAHTAVTNDGLKILAGLPALRVLDIQRTHVTRAGWAPLFDLPKLEVLKVDGILPDSALKSKMFYRTDHAAEPLLESPDGKWALLKPVKKLGYPIAEVYEKWTNKQVGAKFIYPITDHDITCHAFSPDGKYVALGAGSAPYKGWNVGTVSVWEIGSGELLYFYRPVGVVHKVAFAPDSRGLYFVADKFVRDGP